MNISQLLEALKDPSAALTIGEKLIAGVSVAILSMSVVFIVLVIILAIISLLQMEKVKNEPIVTNIDEIASLNKEDVTNDTEDMSQLVAVITAAISAATGNSVNNILVKKIVRSNNAKSSWESMSKNITK